MQATSSDKVIVTSVRLSSEQLDWLDETRAIPGQSRESFLALILQCAVQECLERRARLRHIMQGDDDE